jgi:O-antigen/teichoic acid export membrane protein
MEHIRKVIHGSGFRVIGMATTVVVGFLLMPWLVHHLGDRIYGYWALVGAILGYYGVLDFGIVTAVEWHVAKAIGEKDPTAANRAISTAFYTFAGLGGVILLITIVLAGIAHIFVTSPSDAALFQKVVLITGIGFATGFPGRAFLGALSAHLRWDLISAIGLANLLLRTGLIVFVISAGGGLVSLAAVSVLGDLLAFISYLVALRRIQDQFKLSFALASLPTLKGILPYSTFTFIIKINDQLRLYIDPVVVSAFVNVGAVTHYAIGQRLSLTFRDFMISLLGILAPWFSRLFGSKDYAAMRKVLAFGTKISVSTATIITSILLLYGKPFIVIWMGTNYLDAYWVLFFLATAAFCEVSQFPSMSYLYGVSRHRFLAYITLGEAALNVVLSLYLVRIIGIAGVALGTTIPCFAVRLFIQPVYVCRHAGLSLKRYYFSLFGRAMGATALGVLLPWALVFRWVSRPNMPQLFALVGCQCLIAMLVAFTFALGKDERAAISNVLPRIWRGEKPVPASTESVWDTAKVPVPETQAVPISHFLDDTQS